MYIPPDLKIGDKSAEIGNWQRFLNSLNLKDWTGTSLKEDENFGLKTSFVTRHWQDLNHLPDTGIVRVDDRRIAQNQGFIPFIQAVNCKILYPAFTKNIDLIVIHTMEHPERPDGAENVALWFAGKTKYTPPVASAQYCVDQDSIVQCVRDLDVAWHAPGANHNGIGIEHDGYARQSKKEWEDDASLAILRNSARLSAKLVKKYNVPIIKISPDEVKAGGRGFCGHVDVSLAFQKSNHYDPGVNFPFQKYLDMVQGYI